MRIMVPLAIGAMLLTGGLAQLPQPPFEVGQAFPDLTLPSMEDGSPVSVADFRGRKLLLQIFASW